MSTNRQYVGPTFAGTIDISATTPLYNLPTANVLRSGSVNPANLDCINIIGGFAVVLESAGFVSGQQLLIVATGGVPATLKLDNGGTIGGLGVYTLNPGTALSVTFDGTNLS
jgi:hypothetical protein